jgi:leader peptidase (prepilin peptidase)/N-methyltransferase
MSVIGAAVAVLIVGWAGALSVFDLIWRRLPNALTIGGAAVVLAGAVCCGRGVPALVGATALGVLYLAVHLADPAALGGGDVKLAFALGGLTGGLGLPVWILAALGAPLLTAAAGALVLTARLAGRGAATTLPRGPMMLPRGPMMLPHGASMCIASLAAAALAVV